jgi:hypothetical protein
MGMTPSCFCGPAALDVPDLSHLIDAICGKVTMRAYVSLLKNISTGMNT